MLVLLSGIVAIGASADCLAAGNIVQLETVGQTYPIVEPDVTQELKNQAKELAASARTITENYQDYQPTDLHQLPPAKRNSSYLVDMHYTLKHDYLDGNGKIIYPKGYRFNPLNHLIIRSGYVVINGADPTQIKWFQNSPYADNLQAKLLISNGSAQQLVDTLQRPVYYLTKDIAKRLQLRFVPSVIIPQNKQMLVTEIAIEAPPGGDRK